MHYSQLMILKLLSFEPKCLNSFLIVFKLLQNLNFRCWSGFMILFYEISQFRESIFHFAFKIESIFFSQFYCRKVILKRSFWHTNFVCSFRSRYLFNHNKFSPLSSNFKNFLNGFSFIRLCFWDLFGLFFLFKVRKSCTDIGFLLLLI